MRVSKDFVPNQWYLSSDNLLFLYLGTVRCPLFKCRDVGANETPYEFEPTRERPLWLVPHCIQADLFRPGKYTEKQYDAARKSLYDSLDVVFMYSNPDPRIIRLHEVSMPFTIESLELYALKFIRHNSNDRNMTSKGLLYADLEIFKAMEF